MKAEDIIGFVIFLLVTLIMFAIGISQILSNDPVGFYTGEKPPKRENIRDVNVWNKKHGAMWLLYGVATIVGYGIGYIMGNTIWSAIPMCGGVIIPLPIMIWYHHVLVRKYYVK